MRKEEGRRLLLKAGATVVGAVLLDQFGAPFFQESYVALAKEVEPELTKELEDLDLLDNKCYNHRIC